MRVLVIGGYGFFGDKLCQLLAKEDELTLLIAGRNLDKASSACAKYTDAETDFLPIKLDRSQDLASQLGDQAIDLIVDVSGPFQVYGGTPYRVVEYALSIGAHYFDIADGSEFVSGIGGFNEKAKRADTTILSGVSTYPALSSAVVTRLSESFDIVTDIRSGIAPSPHTDMGRSVVDAIASYAGKAYPVLREGQSAKAYGLTDGIKRRITPPGAEPLDMRLFSDVDAPDARMFDDHFHGLRSVWNGAGPKPGILLLCLIGLAHLVRLRLLPGLLWLSPMFHACMQYLAFGRHRSGMFVDVTGLSNGRKYTRSWHLIAEGDDGPFIPVMPLAILVRKALMGAWPEPGARACMGDVTLADYETEFARRNIVTGVHETPDQDASLYETILGSSYKDLSQPVQNLHRNTGTAKFTGRAKIGRGRNPLARLIANIFRFPKTGTDISVSVTFTAKDGIETWVRDFGGRRLRSTQARGTERFEHLMVESFGPFSVGIALVVKEGRLYNIPQNWSFLGLPLPKFLRPLGNIYEHDANGRFNFHVEIKAPLLGLLVKYEGWLNPVSQTSDSRPCPAFHP